MSFVLWLVILRSECSYRAQLTISHLVVCIVVLIKVVHLNISDTTTSGFCYTPKRIKAFYDRTQTEAHVCGGTCDARCNCLVWGKVSASETTNNTRASGSVFLLPWANLEVGWHPAEAPPSSVHSGKSRRAHTTGSSGAYRSPRHDGCTATGVCSETSRGGGGSRPRDKQAAGRRGCNRLLRWDGPGPDSPRSTSRAQRAGVTELTLVRSQPTWAVLSAAPTLVNVTLSTPVFFAFPLSGSSRRVAPRRVFHSVKSKTARLHLSAEAGSIVVVPSRPGVNFLSRPVSDPEHSLPHSNPTSSLLAAPPTGPSPRSSRHIQGRHDGSRGSGASRAGQGHPEQTPDT